MPAYMAKDQAPAYYEQGTPDGKRPGIFFVNTYNYQQRLLTTAEDDRIPRGDSGASPADLHRAGADGHAGVPQAQLLHRVHRGLGACIAERLGKDVGFYKDPYSDYGRLEGDMWRAIRLVVDTGVHSEHWTRQQMVDYFHEHSAIDETTHSVGGGPLHRVAGAGAGLQDGAAEVSGAAREGAEGAGAEVRHPRHSTTWCWTRARCRWMCWSSRWMRGLRRSSAGQGTVDR